MKYNRGRKNNKRTGVDTDFGNEQRYSSAIMGSIKEQSRSLAEEQAKKNSKSPVKILTKEEMAQLELRSPRKMIKKKPIVLMTDEEFEARMEELKNK